MNTEPQAGEVWFADLGLVGKSRPVLIWHVPRDEDARSLVVPLTSQIRGLRGEVDFGKASLATKALHGQYTRLFFFGGQLPEICQLSFHGLPL